MTRTLRGRKDSHGSFRPSYFLYGVFSLSPAAGVYPIHRGVPSGGSVVRVGVGFFMHIRGIILTICIQYFLISPPVVSRHVLRYSGVSNTFRALYMSNFSYTVRRSKRAKRMHIDVHRDGSVVVVGPAHVSLSVLDSFVRERSPWVVNQIDFFKAVGFRPLPVSSREEYLKHKDQARALAESRLRFYCGLYGVSYNRLYIRNQKTCWGSCTTRKNISLNYRILFLPKRLRDYVIVHELCHLKELNHSEKFWSLVSRACPDYRALRAELRDYDLYN